MVLLYFSVSGHNDSDLAHLPFVFSDAEDFTPLPPVLAKEATQVKSQWDDEDAEEEPVEEKPKVVRVF